MTKIIRKMAAHFNRQRVAELRQTMPHNISLAAIGVTAPEFL